MYDELIQSLRCCADDPCDDCKFCGIYMDSCDGTLKNEAADAIEDLQTQLREEKVDNINLTGWLVEEYAKHLWVPVTERLPKKKREHYLCLLDDDSMAVVLWAKVPDRADKGAWAWHNPNWKDVTHWMPLPHPPKE